MMIRQAKLGDEHAIAEVHVQSWQTTYRNLLNADYLAQLSIAERENGWRQLLQTSESCRFIQVLEDEHQHIVGFVSSGPNREQHVPANEYDGEIYAIYMLKNVQGQGWGKAMLKSALKQLYNEGNHSVIVWALQGNQAIEFYQHMGATYLQEKPIKIGGKVCNEVALVWQDLKGILSL